MARFARSRLSHLEEKRSRQQTLFFVFLTLLLIAAVFFLGIPLLIRLAIFLGELQSSGQPIEVGDTIPPAPPTLETLQEATNSARLSLSGFAEAGSSVELFLNGQAVAEKVADAAGEFGFPNLTLKKGNNSFFLTATDNAGNVSQASQSQTVVFDDQPPPLSLFTPENGAAFFGPQKSVKVEGQTEAGASVSVNGHQVVVGPEGKFSYNMGLSEGENEIKVSATDRAGNRTEETRQVTYTP